MFNSKDKRLKNIKDYDTYCQIHGDTFKILSEANGYQNIGNKSKNISKDQYMDENLKKCQQNDVSMIFESKETRFVKDSLVYELLKRRNQGRDPYQDDQNPQFYKNINHIEFADEIQDKMAAVPDYKRQNTPMTQLCKPKTMNNAQKKLKKIQRNLNNSINDQDILNKSKALNIDLAVQQNRRASSEFRRQSQIQNKKSFLYRRDSNIQNGFETENQRYVNDLVKLNFYDSYNQNFEQKQPFMQQEIVDNFCQTLQNSSLNFVLYSAQLRGINSFNYSKYLQLFSDNQNVQKIKIARKKSPKKKLQQDSLDEYIQKEIIQPMIQKRINNHNLKKLTTINMDTFCSAPNIQDQINEQRQKLKNFRIKELKRTQNKLQYDQDKNQQHMKRQLNKLDQKLEIYLRKKSQQEIEKEILKKQIEDEQQQIISQKQQLEQLKILEEIRLQKENQQYEDEIEFSQSQILQNDDLKNQIDIQQDFIELDIQKSQNRNENNQIILQNLNDQIFKDYIDKVDNSAQKQQCSLQQQEEIVQKIDTVEDLYNTRGFRSSLRRKDSFQEHLNSIQLQPTHKQDIQLQQKCIQRYQKRMQPLYFKLLN